MIEISHLTKRFGSREVLSDLNFSVSKGEILGFLGRNGAGKTTTMNILTGYLAPTEGRVRIAGRDLIEEPRAVKRMMGYLPETPPLYGDMTVREYLSFVCQIRRVRRSPGREIESVCERVGVADAQPRLIRNLSKGYRQRVGMAQALIGDPEILVLDEPTTGLDPGQISGIRELIRSLGESHTVILSSHILSEVSELCDRVVIIHQGRVVANDSLRHLFGGDGAPMRLTLRLGASAAVAKKTLESLSGVSSLRFLPEKEAGTCEALLEASDGSDLRRPVFYACARDGLAILGMRRMEMTLEDVFLQLTAGGEGAEP